MIRRTPRKSAMKRDMANFAIAAYTLIWTIPFLQLKKKCLLHFLWQNWISNSSLKIPTSTSKLSNVSTNLQKLLKKFVNASTSILTLPTKYVDTKSFLSKHTNLPHIDQPIYQNKISHTSFEKKTLPNICSISYKPNSYLLETKNK